MMSMFRARGVLLALAAAVLFVSSCTNSRTAAPKQANGTSRTARPSGAATTASPGVSPGTTRPGNGSPSPAASHAPAPSGTSLNRQKLRLEIVLAECLERGKPASALIKTAPGAMIGASAAYSDGDAHDNYWVGVADVRGEYPIAWTPPGEAPLGKGKFLAGVQSQYEGSNTALEEFRLVLPGGCG